MSFAHASIVFEFTDRLIAHDAPRFNHAGPVGDRQGLHGSPLDGQNGEIGLADQLDA
jgi:hypothetical protein